MFAIIGWTSFNIIYGLFYILLCSYFYSTCTGFSIIMELLIEEFLIHFPLILSLILQSKLSIESSKGIYSIILQCKEFLYYYFSLTDRLIGSIHYFTTGLYGFHVLLGSFLFFIILFYIMFSSDYPFYFMEFSFL